MSCPIVRASAFYPFINRVDTGQEMVREKTRFFRVKEKSGNFIFSQGKLTFLKLSEEKLK